MLDTYESLILSLLMNSSGIRGNCHMSIIELQKKMIFRAPVFHSSSSALFPSRYYHIYFITSNFVLD